MTSISDDHSSGASYACFDGTGVGMYVRNIRITNEDEGGNANLL